MAGTKKVVKRRADAQRPRSSGKTARKRSPGTASAQVKDMVSSISDTTGRQLKRLGRSLESAKEKETKALKDISDKVRQFAGQATQLTKLKIELHNLKQEHESLLRVMGENLWNIYKADRLTQVRSKLKYDLKRLQEVEAEIKVKKRTATRITTSLKNIG